jgi:hypothetical protein
MNQVKTLLILTVIFFSQTSLGQYQNAWFRGTLSKPFGQKIKADAEVQHRRQSGYGNRAILDENLMYTFRTWVHYQINHDIRFSVSPFSYFNHYRIIQNAGDKYAKPTQEIRYSAALDLQHKLSRRFDLTNRAAAEFRTFSGVQRDISRLRAKLGVRYEVNKKFKIALFEEYFLNTSGLHRFDHERRGVNIEYMVQQQLKIDLGYIRIKRLPVASPAMLSENNVFLHFTYSLPNTHRHAISTVKQEL